MYRTRKYSACLKKYCIINHYKQKNEVPAHIALGFAAFIRFMKVKQQDNGSYTGTINGMKYTVTDSQAACFSEAWEAADAEEVVAALLSNETLWDAGLSVLPGFKNAVTTKLNEILAGGIPGL